MAASGVLLFPVVVAFFFLSTALGFNLDTEHYTRHGAPGQTPAMFGFTVAAHTERGQSWVMVGAPEAQTSQPNVTKGGAVYRCEPMRDNICAEVTFDSKGNNKDGQGKELDQKSNQWFGATISSGGQDAPFVACAPRYVSFATKDRRDPVGTCYVAKNGFSEIFEYAPCRTRNWGYHRQGSCQAGLGAAISKDGSNLYVGAPGSWYWQGQVYSQSLDDRPNVVSTGESRAIDDDSYLGYSVAAGYFNGNDEQGVAVGMPRGTNLLGKVVIFTNSLQNIQNITGEQLGAYFGYCLCAGDVDGDGLDDLIVGAPLYTVPNNEGKYEVGRIYVIYQNSVEGRFQRIHIRDGVNSKSRFGLSLTSLGDINLDGYGDFAVGAPYDGVSGRGAVYIYHGGPDGVRKKPSQIIKAEDVYQSALSTFGFSVAGGVDLDNNEYNDLVVGAYDSDAVFLFRAKPVVKMMAGVEFVTDSNLISLDEKNCTLYKSKQNVTCTNLKYCLIYNGINVDSVVDFNLQILLDPKKPLDPRLYFINDETKRDMNFTIPLIRNQSYCNNMMVYIKNNIRDKLTPIEAEIRYSMKGQQSSNPYATRQRNPRSALLPILDQNTMNSQVASINIQKNCGPDNVCIPDLHMTANSTVTKYLLGSGENLVIDVVIHNTGEDAFEASYNLDLPRGINFVNIKRSDESDVLVQCLVQNNNVNQSLKCDIGNPLPQDSLVKFSVLLEPYYKAGMPLMYEFHMYANSTNPENEYTIGNNHRDISVEIWVETDLAVESYSIPADILYYNASHYREDNFEQEMEIGPQVVHIYNFKNKGASTVEKAEIFLAWPYETLAGDMLMYVMEQPETSGNIRCEKAEYVNYLNLPLDAKRKTYLDSNSAALKGELRGTISGEETGGEEHSGFSSSGTVQTGGGRTVTHTYSYNSTHKYGNRTLTEEQMKKIDEEERRIGAETGDGSQIHIQRAQQAHMSNAGQGGRAVGDWNTIVYQNGTQGQWREGGYNVNSQAGGRTNQYGSGSGETRYVYTQGGTQGGAGGVGNTGGETKYVYTQGGTQGGAGSVGKAGGETRYVYTQGGTQGGAGSAGSSTGETRYVYTQEGTQGGVNAGSNQGKQWSTTQTGNWNVEGGRTESRGQDGASGQTVVSSTSREGGAGGSQSGQWGSAVSTGTVGNTGNVIYTSNPKTEYRNRTYTTWNSTLGKPIVYHTIRNITSIIDADGNVKKTESSTEYYTQGAEGEAGSSFNNRISGASNSYERTYGAGSRGQSGESRYSTSQRQGQVQGGGENQGQYGSTRYHSREYGYNQGSNEGAQGQGQTGSTRYYGQSSDLEQGQGGSTRYGTGSYTTGGARRVNVGGHQSSRYNTSSQRNWNEGNDGYASGASGTRHAWSTEETVNKDLANAGSRAFVLNQGSSSGQSTAGSTRAGGGVTYVSAGNTYVGSIQDPGPLGAAAAGKGYRVSALDLGALQSIEDTGSASENARRTNANRQRTSWHADRSQGGDSKSYESSSSYQSNSGVIIGDNVPTSRPEELFRWDHQQRVKRQISEDEKLTHEQMNEKRLKDAMLCPGLKCNVMRCVTGALSANNEIWVAIRGRVNAQTLKKLAHDRPISLASVGVLRVLEVHHLGTPLDREPYAQQAVTNIVPRTPPQEAEPVPLWIVLLSAFAGTALLLLLIFALYKLGFFRRHRPETPERQPLNRNGYGHGDEQL
ncbi:integrin subunit alpha inflated isoform X2 [Arctopsyche grandis]|uniref:integrin subunit alpha inflated isoform X2 n=1 Tax=Arctopsyche grandis TaxID=121162 RepID=UPI00406D953A